jgi:hypothetical protein
LFDWRCAELVLPFDSSPPHSVPVSLSKGKKTEMEINPVVIHDAVMEEQLEFETMNAEEQDSGSEVSDEDIWDIDPIIRSETILKAAASGAASDCQINTLSVSGWSLRFNI